MVTMGLSQFRDDLGTGLCMCGIGKIPLTCDLVKGSIDLTICRNGRKTDYLYILPSKLSEIFFRVIVVTCIL